MRIVIPFSRNYLQKELIKLYKPLNIILHPIQHEDLKWDEDWIIPVKYPLERNPFDICYDKMNFFKETFDIIDNEYYMVIGDDDALELNVPEEINKMDDDIVVISLKRGDDVPISGSICGTCTLEAREEAMKEWYTGFAQIIMKGYAFKKLKYRDDTHIADGCMAEDVVNSKYNIAYRPDLFVKHNYYQPGRWERYSDKSFYEGI